MYTREQENLGWCFGERWAGAFALSAPVSFILFYQFW
jgi:hypothetical protein